MKTSNNTSKHYSSFAVLFFINKAKVKKNGLCPVMGRITVDGKVCQFSTKQSILPKDWSVKSCRAIGRSAAIVQINSLLDEIKSSLHTIYHDMQRRDNYVTAEKVKNEFLGHGQTGETLLDMFAKHNEDVKALVGISKSPATYQKY